MDPLAASSATLHPVLVVASDVELVKSICHDLKQLGYRPGPQFKQILDALRGAVLDKELSGEREAAIDWLAQNYPINSSANRPAN